MAVLLHGEAGLMGIVLACAAGGVTLRSIYHWLLLNRVHDVPMVPISDNGVHKGLRWPDLGRAWGYSAGVLLGVLVLYYTSWNGSIATGG